MASHLDELSSGDLLVSQLSSTNQVLKGNSNPCGRAGRVHRQGGRRNARSLDSCQSIGPSLSFDQRDEPYDPVGEFSEAPHVSQSASLDCKQYACVKGRPAAFSRTLPRVMAARYGGSCIATNAGQRTQGRLTAASPGNKTLTAPRDEALAAGGGLRLCGETRIPTVVRREGRRISEPTALDAPHAGKPQTRSPLARFLEPHLTHLAMTSPHDFRVNGLGPR